MSSRGHHPITIERLEARLCCSAINLTALVGNQSAAAIAVNPAQPAQVVAVSNLDTGLGLELSTSSDSGVTWQSQMIANSQDTLPAAFGQASLAFDAAGSLFLAYVSASQRQIIILQRSNGSDTFNVVGELRGAVSNPVVATGQGSVWVGFQEGNNVAAAGAKDAAGIVSSFQHQRTIPDSRGATFSDIAIAPPSSGAAGAMGLVAVSMEQTSPKAAEGIYLSTNATGGVSSSFGAPVRVTALHFNPHQSLPAQPGLPIDAGAQLAFANPSDTTFGKRLYLVYEDTLPPASSDGKSVGNLADTDIFLRYLDPTPNKKWSQPIRVNSDDTSLASQFQPKISTDHSPSDTTDPVAISWYDARSDLGTGGPTDTDGVPNTDVTYDTAVLTPAPNGMNILNLGTSENISVTVSNEIDSHSAPGLGDSLAFFNNQLFPLWSDNSNSTGDNPNGFFRGLNSYTTPPIPVTALVSGATTTFVAATPDAPGPGVPRLNFSNGQNQLSAVGTSAIQFTITYANATDASASVSAIGPDGPATLQAGKKNNGKTTSYGLAGHLTPGTYVIEATVNGIIEVLGNLAVRPQ
ncbi:MAG TPA: hypothetical protein VFW23_10685 [Tepidisphaeraceae bacterium]|nr:hypothetical protein [Tepidisphaeraceae bacterium]